METNDIKIYDESVAYKLTNNKYKMITIWIMRCIITF